MASRLYRPRRDDRVAVGQDVLREHAHNISREQLIPRIAVENHIAVETVVTPIWFYRRIRKGEGRQCSCFDIEVSPNSTCRCCFGTGTVGGYDKYGTHLEVFDVTHPAARAVNVYPDYERRDRPRQYILIPGATRGYATVRMYPQTTTGTVDHIFALTDVPLGTTLDAYVKAPTDTEWQEFSITSIEQRLFNPWIDIRVELRRASVAGVSPRFGTLFIRYNRLTDLTLKANIPRAMKSNALQEFGVTNDWQTQQFWLDNTLRSVTSSDWIAHTNEETRWRIQNVNEFAPEGLLTSWDLDAKLVQSYEPLSFFPL